jgi:hypothetical protein
VSEQRARAEVYARSGGIDEILGYGRAEHWSHREAQGKGGLWRPANGLHVSARVHAWLHAHPVLARAGGWHLRSGEDARKAPVWLSLPWAGWWLIDDVPGDGGAHLLVPAAGMGDSVPTLPVFSCAQLV